MAEGYCNKCKIKKEITDAVEVIMKNGRKAIKGKCPTCGTVIFKIIGGKIIQPPQEDKVTIQHTSSESSEL